MKDIRIIPADAYETEEDRLRTRHLRAFATAGRTQIPAMAEWHIMTPQPALPEGLRRLGLNAKLDRPE